MLDLMFRLTLKRISFTKIRAAGNFQTSKRARMENLFSLFSWRLIENGLKCKNFKFKKFTIFLVRAKKIKILKISKFEDLTKNSKILCKNENPNMLAGKLIAQMKPAMLIADLLRM